LDWKKYCRAFLRIAGSLLNEEKISTKEYSTYFWQGIRRRFGVELEPTTYEEPRPGFVRAIEVEEVDTAASAFYREIDLTRCGRFRIGEGRQQ